MRRSEAPDFVERRNAATNAKKAALEKFRAHAGDPGLAERQTARVALAGERTAAKKAREIEKAKRKAHDAELAMEAKRAADAQAERALAETASHELALQTERKAARDARYAARKARSKRR
jgi:Family of unknown function (DUF6481)